MITLGLETSCDETSAALVDGSGRVLANVISSSLLEHRKYGGVVPEIASRAQLEVLLPTLEAAFRKARKKPKDVSLVAVTQGPGLLGPLLVGLSAAKALALGLGKPIVGVDHVIAHAYAGKLEKPHLRFPYVALVVSGGHTVLLRMDSARRYEVLGSTLDDAAGEAFDKVAKILGLRYPGGPEIDRLAKGQDPGIFPFTRPYLANDSLDFSFSGIKTAVYHEVERLKKAGRLTLKTKKALSAGFQEAVCDVLVEKTLRAAERCGVASIVVGGGVSANSRLRAKMTSSARRKGLDAVFPSSHLCQDNAAMIAALGGALYREGRRDSLELSSYPDFGRRA